MTSFSAWSAASAWLQAALAGMAAPAVIALALALTTLLLEDLAIAAGVALAAQGALSWELSFVAVAGGIALGDLGLYGLGLAARRVERLRRRFIGDRAERIRQQLAQRLSAAVLLARVIPGLRLLTYTGCGFLRVPLLPFTAWVLLATGLWTLGLFALSAALGHALAERLGVPAPVAVALPILLLAAAVPLGRIAWRRTRGRLKGVPA